MGSLFPPPAPPNSGGGGSGIPNATLFWATVAPINPAPFIIVKGDGKITGNMFTFRGSGQYVLDLSSLLTVGIFAVYPGGVYDAGAGFNNFSLMFCNSTFSGALLTGAGAGTQKTMGIINSRWNGSTYTSSDDNFSIMIFGQ